MRARLALASSGLTVELREILLRDKPHAFLQTSPSATVPALHTDDRVLDESLDIMIWALERHDPERLLDMPKQGWDLISVNDGPFKSALDHTKYAVRYPDLDPLEERKKAAAFLQDLDARFAGQPWIFGARPTLADLAILPFVRQFANIDLTWFEAQNWPHLKAWLQGFVESERFGQIMQKYKVWSAPDAPVWFGPAPEQS